MPVYFIEAAELNRIKIGHATDLRRRFSMINMHSPVALTLMGFVDGGAEVECVLHERFSADRQRGEWFSGSPALRAFIKANAKRSEAATNRKPPGSTFAYAVRAARDALGLTQLGLAQRLGCTPSTIYRVEAGGDPSSGLEKKLRDWCPALPKLEREAA